MKSRSPVAKVRATAGKLAKDVLGRVIVGLGLHRKWLKGNAIVVAFHSVVPGPSAGALRCGLRDFDRYCAFFARHLPVETYEQTVERLQGRGALNGELSITFDDGYADNAELALAVLQRWRLPAIFFVSTDFIGSETQTFWDRDANVRSRWMGWSQVRELVAAGHEIGSHTVSHANLAELGSAEIASELRGSSEALQRQIGAKPRHFAIPFGRTFATLEEAVRIARDAGFKSVSLCRGGLATHSNSALCIERWPINPDAYLSPYGWMLDVLRECRRSTSP